VSVIALEASRPLLGAFPLQDRQRGTFHLFVTEAPQVPSPPPNEGPVGR